MSNKNNTRNIYNIVEHSADNEEILINSSQQIVGSNMTTINIENDMASGSSQHLQGHLQPPHSEVDATAINIETNVNTQTANGRENQNIDDRQRMPNLFSMLREARHQFNRSQYLRDPSPAPNDSNSSRTWRENLYEVLSSPVSQRTHTNVLRAILTPSSNVLYDTLHRNVLLPDDEFRFMFNINQTEEELRATSRSQQSNTLETYASSALRLSRQNSRLTENMTIDNNSTSEVQTSVIDGPNVNNSVVNSNNRRQSINANSAANSGRQPQRQISVTGSTTTPTVDMTDDLDANAVGEMIVKILTHFIRYLPFIFIIFVKFIHDYLLGILDILVLQGVVYQLNKSIKEQVAKLNQKVYAILVRDWILVVIVVTYRFILSTSSPDPFGLLINPPGTTVLVDFITTQKTEERNEIGLNIPHPLENEVPSSATTNFLSNTVSVNKTLSLGTLLYYVAVNDLILKLVTQLIKIMVTMFPTKVIRNKSRARLFALIETSSQFYRSLVPIRQWLRYLFESYKGFEVISGILFSSFYIGAKFLDLFERGKPLRNSIVKFIRNMDYDRKPTKDELEVAGNICSICHDTYTSPIILKCGHIFCDECVNTWFKREQTCPMCRAKVSDDPAWQDGATTYFYQLH